MKKTVTKRTILLKSMHCILKYKKLSLILIISSLGNSIFEIFSVTTLIPFFQGLLNLDRENYFIFNILSEVNHFLSGSEETLTILLLIFILLMVVLKNVCQYINSICIGKIMNYVRKDLQIDLFNTLADSDLKFFNTLKIGHLIGNISVYSDSIARFVFTALNLFVISIKIIFFLTFLIVLSWKFTAISILIGMSIFPIIQFFLSKIRNAGSLYAESITELNLRMLEMFNFISLTKIFNAEEYEKKKFKDSAKMLAEQNYLDMKYSSLLTPLSEVLVTIIITGIFLFSILFLKMDIKIYLPLIGAYLYVFYRLFAQVDIFMSLLTRMNYHLEPFNEYEKILYSSKQAITPKGKINFEKFKEGILFKDVAFSYTDDKLILADLNFFIPKNTFTALVGPTGTGKTSIVNLIAGLYFVTKGKIYIDNNNITDIDLTTWRKKIGFVTQETMIFNNTIKYNLSYGNFNAKEEDLIEAAKTANIHNYIISLPEKYDTILGERGVKLSGGQKQLISIARAILSKPEILILDEATSSLDSKTEKQVQDAIQKISENRTVIAIAHRLSTIINADKIIVFNEGKIVEEGKHTELVEKNGTYSKLYNIQFKKDL